MVMVMVMVMVRARVRVRVTVRVRVRAGRVPVRLWPPRFRKDASASVRRNRI